MMSAENQTKEQRVGGRLESARKELRYSLEEAEQITNIHARHLAALERGDFEALPSRAWARGFLVRYANQLGLEGETLASEVIPLRRPHRSIRYIRRRWRGLVAASATLAVVMITFAVVILAPYNVFSRQITDALEKIAPGIFLGSGPQRVVVLGFAQSAAIGSDNVLAAKVAQDGFGLLAIPGDTPSKIPGHGEREVGDAVAIGGPDLTRRTVARLTETEIPYYLMIGPEGVKDVVDEMGSVQIEVLEPVTGRSTPEGPQITLPPGSQALDGDEALVYLQGNDLRSNAERAKRQQRFLYTMFGQTIDLGTLLSNPGALGALLEHTKTNLNYAEVLQLAGRVKASTDAGETIETDVMRGREGASADD